MTAENVPSQPAPTVFVVDDDPVAAAFAAGAAVAAGFKSRQFSSAEEFLAVAGPQDRGCLVLDLQMGGMTGLQLQNQLLQAGIDLPVIVVSGRGDVSSAVTAMKQRAVDFFVKPVDLATLVESVQKAVKQDACAAAERAGAQSVLSRFRTLSPREKQVMAAVVAGLANKQIAAKLDLSEKTIEVHRGNVMRKMCVDSVAALVRASLVCPQHENVG